MSRVRAVLLICAMALLAAAGCGGDDDSGDTGSSREVPSWPPPANPLELTERAGLTAQRRETLTYHVHAHLDVFVDGSSVLVPAGIGIKIDDLGVKHSADPVAYGGIDLCDAPCISPLHTHDETGVIHTESGTSQPNTLGQFFVEWDVKLDESCVGDFCRPETPIEIYIDGEKFGGDPRTILLTQGKQIAIVIGSLPARIPTTYDFSNA